MGKKIRAFAPTAVWMLFIFAMSAQTGEVSGAESGKLTELLLLLLRAISGGRLTPNPDTLHFLVRKGAHMTEYAVLFLLSRRAFEKTGGKRPTLWALLLCAGYAATDEFHQGFTEGRGPSGMDVMIDTLGATLAAMGRGMISTLKPREARKGV